MTSLTAFLEKRLKIKVNREKSAVARPWERSFLGYSVTMNKRPKLKPSKESFRRLREKVRAICKWGRGRALRDTITKLSKLLQGWWSYFRLCEVKKAIQRVDQWIRHRLRTIVWFQWKTPQNRYKRLVSLGLDRERAKKATGTGRGPWWNGSASHMNVALQIKDLRAMGLISLSDRLMR